MDQSKEQEQFQYPRRERTQIMTPKEAAKYLGFHLVTIYRLLKKGDIPATKIGAKTSARAKLVPGPAADTRPFWVFVRYPLI